MMAGSGSTRRKNRAARRSLREESANRRRKQEQSISLGGFCLRIGILFGIFFLSYFILSNCGVKVEEFDITGNRIVSDEDVISLSGISVGDELFKTDTDASERQITMHVMIDRVDVRVRPFHKILIQVEEKNAVAGFMDDDTYFYIDENKVVVGENDKVDEALPLFSGFALPEFISIGLPLEDPLLDSDLKIAAAAAGLFDDYQMEISAVSESENHIFLNGIQVRLGTLGRLNEKMQSLNTLIHSMSVQKLESLEYIDISIPDEPMLQEKPVGGAEASVTDEPESDKKTNAADKAGTNKRDTTEAE